MSSSWHFRDFPPPLSTIWFSNSWYFLDKKWNCSNPVDSQRLTGFKQLTRKIIIAQMVSSNNKIVSSRFFEQSNFEQMIVTLLNYINHVDTALVFSLGITSWNYPFWSHLKKVIVYEFCLIICGQHCLL